MNYYLVTIRNEAGDTIGEWFAVDDTHEGAVDFVFQTELKDDANAYRIGSVIHHNDRDGNPVTSTVASQPYDD